jgi:hypothetical protein
MEEEDSMSTSSTSSIPVEKLSYASATLKGVAVVDNVSASDSAFVSASVSASVSESIDDNVSDFSDFTLVSRKKCENALAKWAKNKQHISVKTVSKPVVQCSLGDKHIICNQCDMSFIFTAKSKKKYDESNWKSPKICKVCSQMRYEDRKIII